MQQLSTLDAEFAAQFDRLVDARREADGDVVSQVADILRAVKTGGDDALVQFTQRFDGYSLTGDEQWVITAEHCAEAYA